MLDMYIGIIVAIPYREMGLDKFQIYPLLDLNCEVNQSRQILANMRTCSL